MTRVEFHADKQVAEVICATFPHEGPIGNERQITVTQGDQILRFHPHEIPPLVQALGRAEHWIMTAEPESDPKP